MSISLQPKVPPYCDTQEDKRLCHHCPFLLFCLIRATESTTKRKDIEENIVETVGQQSNKLQWDSVVGITDTMDIHQEQTSVA